MGLMNFLFGAPPAPPKSAREELYKKIEAATLALTDTIDYAKANNYIVRLHLDKGALNVQLIESIFDARIVNKTQLQHTIDTNTKKSKDE